ncbi:MAG: hypothetical protein P8Y72_18260 [Anaerolineales bacterium]|jgi:hypothetical protein
MLDLITNYASFLKISLLVDFGYLDPGSGSFILQVILASLVGIGFVLRGYWGKVKGLFRKDQTEDDTSNQDHE